MGSECLQWLTTQTCVSLHSVCGCVKRPQRVCLDGCSVQKAILATAAKNNPDSCYLPSHASFHHTLTPHTSRTSHT